MSQDGGGGSPRGLDEADGDYDAADLQPQDDDQQQYDPSQQHYEGGGGDDGGDHPHPNGGGGGGGDDSEDDEEPVPAFLPPEHRLMAPVQAALKKELTGRDVRVTLALREQESALLAVKKRREELGVELYSTQQGLAKLQLSLEQRHQKYEEAATQRRQQETRLKQVLEQYQRTCAQMEDLEKKRLAAQRELDALHVTVQQIDAWNQKVQSEIKVTRSAAYATEDAMQAAEKSKTVQDLQLDRLTEEVRQAHEQITLYEQQLTAQKAETQRATETLKEAQKEMERIATEKKSYMKLWQSSLQGMAARDAALQEAQAAVHEQQERARSIALELAGFKSAIKGEQAENEKLSSLQSRIQSEVKFMEVQLSAIRETRQAYNQKYSLFRQTLERVDGELKASLAEQRAVRGELAALQKAAGDLQAQKRAADDAIMASINSQTTLERGAQNVWSLTQDLKKKVHEQEIAMGDVQNEIARIQVDALNTGAHNKELTATRDAYERELKEKGKLIEKYELEIRQRHDKIEKKQIYIARLNRKFEALQAAQASTEDQHTGPLEATINNLHKEMASTEKAVGEKQREWIKLQTELVAVTAESQAVAEEARELESRETIFSQKRLRSSNQVSALRAECKQISHSIAAMHNDLSRLNDLIASQSALSSSLSNGNYTLESDFMLKLKQMELRSVEMDAQLVRLKDAKDVLFAEMVEVEKQVLLWEKKTQLERETQEALDPQYGQPELHAMKKEIHRMKLRLAQLKRQQEKMIAEMELTIAKREGGKGAALLPGAASGQSSKAAAALTAAQLKQKLVALKQELGSTHKEARKVAGDVQKQEEQNAVLAEELHKQQQVYNALEDARAQLAQQQDEAALRRHMLLQATLLNQKRTKKYEEAILNGGGGGAASARGGNRDEVLQRLAATEEEFQRIKEAVHRMQQDEPKHAQYFQRLLAYM